MDLYCSDQEQFDKMVENLDNAIIDYKRMVNDIDGNKLNIEEEVIR